MNDCFKGPFLKNAIRKSMPVITGRFAMRGKVTIYETLTNRVLIGKLPSGRFLIKYENKNTLFDGNIFLPNRLAAVSFAESYLLNAS